MMRSVNSLANTGFLNNMFYGIVIVKASSGPRYVVGVKQKLERSKLIPG